MAKSGRKGAERPIFDFQGSLKISGYLGHEFLRKRLNIVITITLISFILNIKPIDKIKMNIIFEQTLKNISNQFYRNLFLSIHK